MLKDISGEIVTNWKEIKLRSKLKYCTIMMSTAKIEDIPYLQESLQLEDEVR